MIYGWYRKTWSCATLKFPVDSIMIYDFYLLMATVMTLCYVLRSGPQQWFVHFQQHLLEWFSLCLVRSYFYLKSFYLWVLKLWFSWHFYHHIASLFGTLHCPFSHWELVHTSRVHPKLVGDLHHVLLHIRQISSSKHPPYLPTTAFP